MPGSASGAASERQESPRWVAEFARRRDGDPLGVYARTYSAISGVPLPRPRRRHPVWRLAIPGSLFVGSAVAALAVIFSGPPQYLAHLSWPRFVTTAASRFVTTAARTDDARPLPSPRSAYAPEVIGTMPARPKAAVRVGDERVFAVSASGPDLRYSWTVDGTPAGTGPRWSYAPERNEVGRRRVEVVVTGREGSERRSWAVLVRPAVPPRVTPEPAVGTIETAAASPVRLRVDASPGTPPERLSTVWEVNGTRAGEGAAFTFRPARSGVAVVRAVVRNDLGAAATRQWLVKVAPPPAEDAAPVRTAAAPEPQQAVRAPEPPPARAAAPVEIARATEVPPLRDEERAAEVPAHQPPPPASAVPPRPPASEPALPPRVAPTPSNLGHEPEPARAHSGPARDDGALRYAARSPERQPPEVEVRRWLEGYAAAWRAHDVEALRRMGQVTTEREVDALRAYFDSVHDLDVELNVIALRMDGERAIVRFTRRDRFRDPAGRLVLKESPTLEKQIVRTPNGLRFTRPAS